MFCVCLVVRRVVVCACVEICCCVVHGVVIICVQIVGC